MPSQSMRLRDNMTQVVAATVNQHVVRGQLFLCSVESIDQTAEELTKE